MDVIGTTRMEKVVPVDKTIVFYSNEGTRTLDNVYDISKHDTTETVQESLGTYEREVTAKQFLGLCALVGQVSGLSLSDASAAGVMSYNSLYKEGYFEMQIEGNNTVVLYPTEKLLENQYVPKRE